MLFFLCSFVLLSYGLNAQEYIQQTLKEQNLKFSFPKDWRWQVFYPTQEDKKIFEGFNQGKKVLFQIYAEPTKSSNIKQIKKFLKKQQIILNTQLNPIGMEYPNLKNLNAYGSNYFIHLPRPVEGYFIAGNDGILQYYFKIEVLQEDKKIFQETIQKLISSIEPIFEWNQICCSICMKQIRYSKRTTTVCTDYITENPCYQYLKNKKMTYELCK